MARYLNMSKNVKYYYYCHSKALIIAVCFPEACLPIKEWLFFRKGSAAIMSVLNNASHDKVKTYACTHRLRKTVQSCNTFKNVEFLFHLNRYTCI